jgi:hypothetical protein
MEIEFPTDADYGRCMGRLRKTLKPYILHLAIRKKTNGALLCGSDTQISLVLLILPPEYRVISKQQA